LRNAVGESMNGQLIKDNVCTICSSEKLEAVNAALAEHVTVRAVAAQFGFSRSTTGRHKAHCLVRKAIQTAVIEKAQERQEESVLQSSVDLARELTTLKDVIGSYLTAAVKMGKHPPLTIVRELRATQELLIKTVLTLETREASEEEAGPYLRRLEAMEGKLAEMEVPRAIARLPG
jgi:hypothetical protein